MFAKQSRRVAEFAESQSSQSRRVAPRETKHSLPTPYSEEPKRYVAEFIESDTKLVSGDQADFSGSLAAFLPAM